MEWMTREIHDIVAGSDWVIEPDAVSKVSGISIYAPTYRSGDIVFVRTSDEDFGITPEKMADIALKPRLAIVSQSVQTCPDAEAVLQVPNQQKALFALAHNARARMKMPVIGITGSAGKTSVTAMVSHCLAGAGSVSATRFGANMARGISWNLGCVQEDAAHCVLEMAIGQMVWNSQLAKPDVAVFTNIHPAHLIYHKSIQIIAERKAKIFSSMPKSGVAVINADMNESAVVNSVAFDAGLRIIRYGLAADNDIFPVSIDAVKGFVTLSVQGTVMTAPLIGKGAYAVQNVMAVAGAILAVDQPVEELLQRLDSFEAVEGRGGVISYPVAGGLAQIVDHSYNANPASMRAALDELDQHPCQGRRIAILGQMAELGDESTAEHEALIRDLLGRGLDGIYLLGDEFTPVMKLAEHDQRFQQIDLRTLRNNLPKMVNAGDVVMLKGSNSTGLYHLMNKLRQSLSQT